MSLSFLSYIQAHPERMVGIQHPPQIQATCQTCGLELLTTARNFKFCPACRPAAVKARMKRWVGRRKTG